MAIRVLHQPAGSAVGAAAFMTGMGAAAERRRKYAMDMWRDERRLQARREDLEMGYKYRSALGGRRGLPRMAGGGAVALAGGDGGALQVTPEMAAQQAAAQQANLLRTPAQRVAQRREDIATAKNGPGTPEQRVMNRAQDEANARAMRQGRPLPYPHRVPVTAAPLTEAQQQRQWDLEDARTKREQELADRDERRQYDEQLYSKRAKELLEKQDAAIAALMANPEFDDEQKNEALWRFYLERAGIQSTAAMPRPSQRENPWKPGQQEQYFDERLGPGVYKDLRSRGIVPYLDSKGEIQFFESKSQPQAQVQADEQLKKKLEYQEKLQSLAEKRTKAVEDRDFAIAQAKANNPVVEGGWFGDDDTSAQNAAIEAINKRYDELNAQYDEYEKLLREAYGAPSGGAQPAPAQAAPAQATAAPAPAPAAVQPTALPTTPVSQAGTTAPSGKYAQYTDAALNDERAEINRQYNTGELSDTEAWHTLQEITNEQRRRMNPSAPQHQTRAGAPAELPPGAVALPDGTVWYNGKIHRRSQQ